MEWSQGSIIFYTTSSRMSIFGKKYMDASIHHILFSYMVLNISLEFEKWTRFES